MRTSRHGRIGGRGYHKCPTILYACQSTYRNADPDAYLHTDGNTHSDSNGNRYIHPNPNAYPNPDT